MINNKRLFSGICLALLPTAFSFVLVSNILQQLKTEFILTNPNVGATGFGIGNGMIEVTDAPLTAALHPDNKVTKLNHFDTFFLGGMVFVSLSLELGPARWIPEVLQAAGVHGMLVFVWMSGLMRLLRSSVDIQRSEINNRDLSCI